MSIEIHDAELHLRDKRIEELEAKLTVVTGQVTMLGDGITDMFEQLIKGNWIDDHQHDVTMNVSMINLKSLLFSVMNYRDGEVNPPEVDHEQ